MEMENETQKSTVRSKATEWNAVSSKKVPYEFIEFIEGKREPSSDYNCCKWKCTRQNEHFARFETSCGVSFGMSHDLETLVNLTYCPHCRKRIVKKGLE